MNNAPFDEMFIKKAFRLKNLIANPYADSRRIFG